MKLKLVINGIESPEDYKLLRTTVSTVASLRKTAILRFKDERLIIISTPKSPLNNPGTNATLQGDTGQLWCTIPSDVFSLYNVESAREYNTITMEYNCDSLASVFKRYDRVMSQGSSSNMTIKLQAAPEWKTNSDTPNNGGKNGNEKVSGKTNNTSNSNLIYALGITFEEIVHTFDNGGMSTTTTTTTTTTDDRKDGNEPATTSTTLIRGSNKVVIHTFKVPVRLLYGYQDMRIKEPTVVAEPLLLRLPEASKEFGIPFQNFMRRIDRYSNVNNITLQASHKINGEDAKLSLVVDEYEWNLKIGWNGPLDISYDPNNSNSDDESNNNNNNNNNEIHTGSIVNSHNSSNNSSNNRRYNNEDILMPSTLLNPSTNEMNNIQITSYQDSTSLQTRQVRREEEDLLRVDDSEMTNDSSMGYYGINNEQMKDNNNITTTNTNNNDINNPLEDISAMVEKAEQESSMQYGIILKNKDWKVCIKLYPGFDDILLGIAHDQSCIFHCSLDRGEDDDPNSTNNNAREKGQIIYYMLRSKAL